MKKIGFGRYNPEKTARIGRRVRNRIKRRVGSNPYVWEFIRRYQDEIGSLKKPSTQKMWDHCFNEMIRDFGYLKVTELDRQTIQVFFTKLSKRIGAASVHRYWIALCGVLRYAVEEGIIEDFPRPRLPRVYRNSQEWWTIEEMRVMIEGTTSRIKVFIMLLTETGCRIGEALGLQTGDVDCNAKTLSIKRTLFEGRPNEPKTNSSLRTLAISDELCYALSTQMHAAKPQAYIFRDEEGNPWSVSYVTRRMNQVFHRLKLPRKGFHAFRRGNITHLVLNLEIPESIVGQRVGHLSGGMTLGVYVQMSKGLDKKWIGRIAESIYGKD